MMKKLLLGLLVCVWILTMGGLFVPGLSAGGTHIVEFTTSFDDANLEIEYQGEHDYGDRIGFDDQIADVDYDFAFWIVNGHARPDLSADHDFIINGPMTIDAVFSDTEKYAIVFMDANGEMIETPQYIDEGQDATPPASLPDKPGYVIDSGEPWSASYESISEHTILILQYEMSSEETFNINVTNGSGGGVYDYNREVEIIADTPEADDVFQYWEENENIVSYSEHYRFTALRDRDLIAVYGAEAVEEETLVTLSPDLAIRTNHVSYAGQFSFPEGHTLIEYGILRSDTNDMPVHDSPDATRYRAQKHHGPTNEYLMSFADEKVYQRAYLVTEDEHGTLHYTYSGVVQEDIEEEPDYGEEAISVDITKAEQHETFDYNWTIEDENYDASIWYAKEVGDGIILFTHDILGLSEEEDLGSIGISALSITKSIVTMVIEIEVEGKWDHAQILVYAFDDEGEIVDGSSSLLEDTEGVTTFTYTLDNTNLDMDAFQILIHMPKEGDTEEGMTVSISGITIYEKD